jgi:hypothetical protein
VAAFCSSSYGDSKDLSLITRTAFEGLGSARGGSIPILVKVSNRGANTRGAVVLRSTSIVSTYPVDLPTGSNKQFFAYLPEDAAYGECSIALDTDQGSLGYPLKLPRETAEYMCLIGGSTGDMTFLRASDPNVYELQWHDAYGKPGFLPDRRIGYSSFNVVVLGEGAERMTDSEVEALKTWVVSGGVLVFIGGASPAVLNDKRWAPFVPVHSLRQKNVFKLPDIERIAGSPAPAGVITLSTGAIVEGAVETFPSSGNSIIVQKRIGLGRAVYLAFDPFQPPLKQWKGLKKLFVNGFDANSAIAAKTWVMSHADPYEEYEYDPTMDAINSPFQTELPPTGTVLLILFAHLIISVPLNFYVMRRIGRSEMAWVTTPVISIGFAAVFFSLASGLYEAGQSTRTLGVLVASTEHDIGAYTGKAEIFIPRGGQYDLRLNGVESVSTSSNYYYESEQVLHVVDEGTVQIPDIRVSNLAFKEFYFTQRVANTKFISAKARRVGANKLDIHVVNLSPHTLDTVSVQCGKALYQLGTIEPGGEFRGTAQGHRYTKDPWSQESNMVVQATLKGFRAGPQIGADKGSSTLLLYFGGPPE